MATRTLAKGRQKGGKSQVPVVNSAGFLKWVRAIWQRMYSVANRSVEICGRA